MIKLTQLCLLLAIFFLASSVKAAVLIEPVVGLNAGSSLDMTNLDKYTGGGGMGYGGRLGYQKMGFQLGADYFRSSIDMSDDDIKRNLAMTEWAGFVGFEFPVLLRVYGGYVFSADGTSKYNNGTLSGDLKLSGGSGYKVGVGFTGLPFVDINFEYRSVTFGDRKIGSTKSTDDTTFHTLMFGLSVPLNF